jgi:galactose mutarotase-like enzyme
VGGLRADTLRLGEATHRLPKHGFARDLPFAWVERSATACALELRDDDHTREAYPFAFRLRVRYALEAGALRMELSLHNPGEGPLPASLGLHPAFRWPLVAGADKRAHRLVFDADEPGPLRRLDPDGLLAPGALPCPIQDRVLPLHEDLFREDALIFPGVASRGLRYEAPGGPSLRLSWEGFPDLGVWTKPDPGPSFLCLEPWQGHASPSDWDGPFPEKPGAFLLPPRATSTWSLTVSVE